MIPRAAFTSGPLGGQGLVIPAGAQVVGGPAAPVIMEPIINEDPNDVDGWPLERAAGSTVVTPSLYVWILRSSGGTWARLDRAMSLELIESKYVSVAAQTLTFSGLDAPSDHAYLLQGEIVSGGASNSGVLINPNGLTTGVTMQNVGGQLGGSTFASNSNANTFFLFSGGYAAISFTLHPLTGRRRLGWGYSASGDNAATPKAGDVRLFTWQWNDTATALTSIVLDTQVANGFGLGTRLSLYRLRYS